MHVILRRRMEIYSNLYLTRDCCFVAQIWTHSNKCSIDSMDKCYPQTHKLSHIFVFTPHFLDLEVVRVLSMRIS